MRKIYFYWMSMLASFMLFVAPSCSSDSDEGTETPPPSPELEEEFTIALLSNTPISFEVSFTPSDEAKTYYWQCLTKAEFDAVADEDSLIELTIDFLRQQAAANSMTLDALLAVGLKSGYQEWGWDENINPDSDYVVYCFGLNTDATVTTKLSKLEIHTTAVARETCDFEIIVNEETSASKLSLTIRPSNDTTRWYASVFEEAAYSEFCNGDPALIPAYLSDTLWPELLEDYGADLGYSSIRDVVQAATRVGEGSVNDIPVFPNQVYYLFAVGVGIDGSCTTDAKVERWQAPTDSNNTFTLSVISRSSDGASISITPTLVMESYAYVTVRDEQMMVNGAMPDDDAIIARCLEMTGDKAYPALRTYSGSGMDSPDYLFPGTAYTTYVFGCAEDSEKGIVATTSLFKCPFETLPAESYGDNAVDIRVLVRYKNKLSLALEPADDAMTYYYDILPEEIYQADGGNDDAIRKDIAKGISGYMEKYGVSEEAARIQFLNRGTVNNTTGDILTAGTAYRIYAVGMYADGSFSSSVVSVKVETLSEMLPFYVQWTEYEASPYKGAYCYVFVPQDQQSDVENWYFAYLIDDDSLESLTDEELADKLRQGGDEKLDNYSKMDGSYTPYVNQYISFDFDSQKAYAYAVYYTYDGGHGPVMRTSYGK